VLAGVMLAGRVGGALTAELGTMNVTEQLLALRSMGADPVRHLVTPRFLACLILAPLLTCYATLLGALGAWAVYAGVYGGESEPFWFYTQQSVELWDLGSGAVQGAVLWRRDWARQLLQRLHLRRRRPGRRPRLHEAFVAASS
jgi:phospholipid/cholesterol/gamma-HCH transport system permease protein